MIDSHTHLYMEQYAGEENAVVERALATGVKRMMFANVDIDSLPALLKLHEAFPEVTDISIGIHPSDVEEDWDKELDAIEEELHNRKYDAIGEIGLDFHWLDPEKDIEEQKARQRKAFMRQMQMALDNDLPVLIHCRDARDELLALLQEIKGQHGKLPKMVFHSFTGNKEDVVKIREVCDPWFGINGVVTFKNAPELRAALPDIRLERMLLETDAPYLAPTPHRGSRNESSYLPLICRAIADNLGVSEKEVEAATDTNYDLLVK